MPLEYFCDYTSCERFEHGFEDREEFNKHMHKHFQSNRNDETVLEDEEEWDDSDVEMDDSDSEVDSGADEGSEPEKKLDGGTV